LRDRPSLWSLPRRLRDDWRGTLWDWHGPALPWLRTPAVVLIVLAIIFPYFLVEIPPLVDIPGHTGAAGIEAAPAGSPLHDYFGWEWLLTLNLGGEVLMKLLSYPFGVLAAGWWSTVIATALFAFGTLAMIRVLNPRGGHGASWALVFIYSFPLLTGFLNYILATGLSLCAFAASVWFEKQPKKRAILLIAIQPVALLCHAIGGLLLPITVATYELGKLIDEKVKRPKEIVRRLAIACWPLATTVLTILVWKILSSDQGAKGGLKWRWAQKGWSFVLTLRDQVYELDVATMVACILIVLLGVFVGARWNWRRGLPWLAILLMFVAIPSDIQGSALVDIRLLPIAFLIALGLQDWSKARPRLARTVALAGSVVLAARLLVIGAGFVEYREDYARQLAALDHVEPGSRIMVFVQHSCLQIDWRNTRRDHIASLASIYRESWVNDNWAVPGLHMLQTKFKPAKYFSADPSEFVWTPKCGRRLRTIGGALKRAPIDKVDYVWLIDTGIPAKVDNRMRLVWRDGRSLLFAVEHLGFLKHRPSKE
jgi:hypothetical protein